MPLRSRPARDRRTHVNRAAVLAGLLICSAMASCGRPPALSSRIVFMTSGGPVTTGELAVASTPSERQHGLMDVRRLAANEGMLFLFDGPTRASFWMKNTKIPLSVAFWRPDGTVVDILDMRPCHRDPCPLYTPRSDYAAALEMNLGWFRKHGIEIGDHVVGAENSG